MPATLLAGMGSLHHPIATNSAEAQKFFDQGLTFIYAFNHGEAVHSFERAAQLDPHSPMPLWGKALALGPNYNDPEPGREKAAYDAIQEAQELAASAPENERAYVEALAYRFTNDPKPDYKKLGNDYAVAMRGLSRRYPDDPDAATLFAESLMDLHPWELWTNDGNPGENTLEVVSVLEAVLQRWPDHVGANHFYIHAVEASPNPERALASAKRLETMVPAAGHLVHMPAHIYIRTGDYEAAVKSNQQAIAVDREYLGARSIENMGYALGYGEHNFHFLAAAAMMDGDFDTAYGAAKELASQASAAVNDMAGAEAFMPTPVFVLLRFARWDDVLALPKPDAKLKGLTFFWHYAHGCALAAKGQATEAETELTLMEAAYKEIPPGMAFGMMYNDWGTLHALAVNTLDARIAAAHGEWTDAVEHWRAAVAVQDKMNYDEPADWYYPVRESLGAALLRSKHAAEAEQVFREDLERNRRNPRSLFGLWLSLETQQKTAAEQTVRTAFLAAWKGDPHQLRIADF
jgi:tetratricopeptide (TPR) repeat protein